MIFVLEQIPNHDGQYNCRTFADEFLVEAMLFAEWSHKETKVPNIVYQGAVVCKVRWGPEDPGGIFNTGGTPTYDKGERVDDNRNKPNGSGD